LKRLSSSTEQKYSYGGKSYDSPFSNERAKQALANIDRGAYDAAIGDIAEQARLFIN
jgi:hypothetical protein